MQNGTNARRCVLMVIAALWLAAPAAAQVVRVYEVRHRIAEELAPLVETALAGEGRVVADRRTNALVLSGSPSAVASALEILAALDVRARTVRLRYESRRSSELASAGASVRWRAGAGGLRIGDVLWRSPEGDRRAEAAAAIAVEGEAGRRASTLAGELRILDGQSGRIATGTSAPITARRIQRGRRGAVIEESTHYESAESGFEASPRVLRDGRVELALRTFHGSISTSDGPGLEGTDQHASLRPDGAIDRASAETRLVLTPGTTIVLGGIARAESAQRGALTAGGASSAAEESLLLMTVDVE
jgi:type II secretory pathway component GspD/PulD (secretin)